MRIFAAIMTVLFALFAFVQYNDPDSLIWTLGYAYAGMVCLFVLLRFPYYLSAMFGAVGFLYAFSLTARALYQSYNAELLNEFGGLAIALAVMTFWVVQAIKEKRRGDVPTPVFQMR